ncbi:Eco57I restriction-modification methylase domain-containing protein [Herbidospora mongoliensis]|uniref:Eco57I restriction-modification methylase domain-containing protein n=1 Tax=Herbidospora mongoliensis TaxID=688067 RepID=UPI0012F8F5F7|nr:Eco57I restriction-modification methylase domain-containing protein [Herbidospora mongoliensis]
MSSDEIPQHNAAIGSVPALLAWCVEQAKSLDALDEEVVRGAEKYERKVLNALGGVAKSLVIYGGLDTSGWPPEINKWMDHAPRVVDTQIAAAIADRIRSGEDVLGSLYGRIVAGKNRRKLGTFFTPRDIMNYIANLMIENNVRANAIADPGAGVGAFSEAALDLWPEAVVHAVDVNLVTLGLLAASPDSSRQNRSSNLRIWRQEFLGWLLGEWDKEPGPRLIFGNPPYTRHQLLNMEEKQAAAVASGSLSPSGRSGLSTYFLAASLNSLRPDDSLCLLLPVNWLEADYARSVRRHLWYETKRSVDVHLFPEKKDVFPGAQVSAMVLFVGPRMSSESDQPIRIYEVEESNGAFMAGVPMEEKRIGDPPNTLMPAAFRRAAGNYAPSEEMVTLGDVATVRRGVATGNNKFFLLTNKQVAILPEGSYTPAIARLREMEEDCFTKELHDKLQEEGERCWMLQVKKEDRSNAAVDALLSSGEAELVHTAYLCKTRPVWYELERFPTPHLVLSPMSKKVFRVMVNAIGAIPTNTLYGIRLFDAVDSVESRRQLAEWLRGPDGQDALTAIARRHGDGLLKLEPRALLGVKIPKRILRYSEQSHTDTRPKPLRVTLW